MNNVEINKKIESILNGKYLTWLLEHNILKNDVKEYFDKNNEIFVNLVAPAINDPEFIVWKARNMNYLYIQYLGMHAFGIGIYSILTENELNSEEELRQKIEGEDVYWLAFDKANIKEGTKIEEDLYEFINYSVTLIKNNDNYVNNIELITSYMKSMFNMGITFILNCNINK